MTVRRPHIAVLITSYNRRELTLRALSSLEPFKEWAKLSVVLYDDNSDDGTADAVGDAYPETIILRGDGAAFWNGGLFIAWGEALKLSPDAFLWLNDDVELFSDASQALQNEWARACDLFPDQRFILVGSTTGSDGRVTYSGYRRVNSLWSLKFEMVPPSGNLTPVDTINGNIVLVPAPVVDVIGLNDPAFHHNSGDTDYGLRAKAAGIPSLLMSRSLGKCETNAEKRQKGYGSPENTVLEQWRKVNTHHGLPIRSWYRLTRRHSGWLFPLHFLLPYRHLFIPKFWR